METKHEISAERKLLVKMIVDAWQTQNTRLNKLLETLSDEQLMTETSPGRNRGIYLVGHLTAVNDALFPLLMWGERLYPQLENVFIKQPDKSDVEMPSPGDIRKYWSKVNAEITKHISQMEPHDWFSRHSSVSEEDFAKEPHRNRLNVLLSRTNHLSYHLGQLIYLGKRDGNR